MSNLKTSKSFSFKGWNYKAWVAGNAEALKLIIGATVSVMALYPESAPYVAVGGAGMIIVKAVLDLVDFYANEVTLK